MIAHELGHIHRGHVRWHFVLAPAPLVPFLGAALSRAREYTCDRYGAAGAADPLGEPPLDPFDGTQYGYDRRGDEFFIWSVGPDLESWTPDDLTFDSRAAN